MKVLKLRKPKYVTGEPKEKEQSKDEERGR
jgi:hypothetical protein